MKVEIVDGVKLPMDRQMQVDLRGCFRLRIQPFNALSRVGTIGHERTLVKRLDHRE